LSRKAGRMIRENLAAFDIQKGARILELDLSKALDLCVREGVRFDIAFIDPPYDRDAIYKDAFQRFSDGLLLTPEGVLIFEHSKRMEMPESIGKLTRVRSLLQGDSGLAFYRPEVE
jgi:16S rRNA (guanine966-N2)-methyltransferase